MIKFQFFETHFFTLAFAGADNGALGKVSQACNFDCHCSNEIFSPVCGSDKVSYFSPCHAGCKSEVKDSVSIFECSQTVNFSYQQGYSNCSQIRWKFGLIICKFKTYIFAPKFAAKIKHFWL